MVYALYYPRMSPFMKEGFLYRVNERYTKAITILTSVVIGALLLAGLYLLFKDTVLPTLTQKIQEMFNYKG